MCAALTTWRVASLVYRTHYVSHMPDKAQRVEVVSRGVQSMLSMMQDASWVKWGEDKNPNWGILIYCYKFAVIG